MQPRTLKINRSTIAHNARVLRSAGNEAGVEIVGVLKGVLSDSEIAGIFMKAGITTLADSDAGRLRELRQVAGTAELMLLRQPLPIEMKDAAEAADVVLLWEKEAIKALDDALSQSGRPNISVLLSVDAGYGRDGADPSQVPDLVRAVRRSYHLDLAGLAITLNCDVAEHEQVGENGHANNRTMIDRFLELVDEVEHAQEIKLTVVSGGNSGAAGLLLRKELPGRIDQLRLGEAILFGRDTVTGEPLKGLQTGAFSFEAQVLGRRESSDKVDIVLAVGKHDLGSGSAHLEQKFTLPAGVLGIEMNSDHLIVRCHENAVPATLRNAGYGSTVTLYPDYYGLLGLLTRGRIRKQFC